MTIMRVVFGLTIYMQAILYTGLAVAIDTFFGIMRAIKYRCWNSSLGIDGLIRKASMMACVCFAVVIDGMGDFDLIGLFPTDVISFLSTLHITHAGFAEFFAILFICYECVSILKNMYLCNLPVKWIWKLVYKMLSKYTDELPDADEISNKTA